MQFNNTATEQNLRRNSTSERLKPAPVYTEPVTFHYAIGNHTTRMQKLTRAIRVYRLMALTVVCVLAGIVIGVLCRPRAKLWTERHFMYIEFPGELYLRFLKLMILPLLVSNVILAFGTIQSKISSRLAKVAGLLYLASNFAAILMAILVALIMSPGHYNGSNGSNGMNYNSPLSNLNAKPSSNKPSWGHHHFRRQTIPRQEMNNDLQHDSTSPNQDELHLFRDQQDSMSRYREYHPMFYHTNHQDPKSLQASNELRKLERVSMRSRESDAPHPDRRRHLLDAGGNEQTAATSIQNNNKTSSSADAESAEEPSTTTGLNDMARSSQQSGNSVAASQVASRDGLDDLQAHQVGHGHVAMIPRRTRASFFARNRDNNKQSSTVDRPLGLSTKLPMDVVLDAFRNLVPDSLVGAALQQSRTRLYRPKELRIHKNGTSEPPPNRWLMGQELVDQPNIIGLLAMSVMTGVVLSHMGEASKPMLDLCLCISELSLRVGMTAVHTAPFCIMFLLIGQIARARDLSLIAGELLMYVITVIIALALHGVVILPLAYYLITKKSPLNFFKGLLQALVASFATSSSSATMALVLKCLSELDLNLIIVRAFGPLGSVFNMNGTSIFESVAVIFISQMLDVKLPLTSLLLVGLCSAIASLSTSGIPSSGMLTMVIVLNAINLPVLELSLIYIVDFVIDRFRTVINVWSGAIVCGLIDHICPEELFEEEMKPEKYRDMIKYRASRTSLTGEKKSCQQQLQQQQRIGSEINNRPHVISVTITPPPNESIAL